MSIHLQLQLFVAGTVGLVHNYCLEKWISVSCKTRCELCRTKYAGKKKFKYGIISSVPRFIWARKSDCGMFYCYAKIWLYVYILYSLMREYRIDGEHLVSSLAFFAFLVISTATGVVILIYSFLKCVKSWNRWRRCQFEFILENAADEAQQV